MKNIKLYLLFSFGLAWLICLALWLSGGLIGNRGLLLSLCMLCPALAVLITKRITKEGWGEVGFRPRLRRHFGWYLLGWFGPALLILIGAALYFLVHPAAFDPANSPAIQAALAQMEAKGIPVTKVTMQATILGTTFSAMLLAPLLNLFFCAGEELGWRGFLLPQLLKHFSMRKTLLLSGLIWGLWHAPMIAMGHNYGLDYPGWPWAGILAMIAFCFFTGSCFSLLSLKTGSFWPASLAHGSLNGMAAVGLLFLGPGWTGNPFVGPVATGILGGGGFLLAGLLCFLLMKKPEPTAAPVSPSAADFFANSPD